MAERVESCDEVPGPDMQIDEKGVVGAINREHETGNPETHTTMSLDAIRCHLERLAGSLRKRPGYVLRLGVLVSARGLLYQSKP